VAKHLALIVGAFFLTICTAWINPPTDERTMYGMEGPPEENWKPRKVAGWPAPYLADNPNTSVIYTVGIEDVFRPGPFVATMSFWYVVVVAALRLFAIGHRKRN
jgi:hypothetical protein